MLILSLSHQCVRVYLSKIHWLCLHIENYLHLIFFLSFVLLVAFSTWPYNFVSFFAWNFRKKNRITVFSLSFWHTAMQSLPEKWGHRTPHFSRAGVGSIWSLKCRLTKRSNNTTSLVYETAFGCYLKKAQGPNGPCFLWIQQFLRLSIWKERGRRNHQKLVPLSQHCLHLQVAVLPFHVQFCATAFPSRPLYFSKILKVHPERLTYRRIFVRITVYFSFVLLALFKCFVILYVQ